MVHRIATIACNRHVPSAVCYHHFMTSYHLKEGDLKSASTSRVPISDINAVYQHRKRENKFWCPEGWQVGGQRYGGGERHYFGNDLLAAGRKVSWIYMTQMVREEPCWLTRWDLGPCNLTATSGCPPVSGPLNLTMAMRAPPSYLISLIFHSKVAFFLALPFLICW